jgi:RNA polymerase sigma factor (TIGR02999 family)
MNNPHTRLLPLLYNELRQLAASRIALESGGQTLQATALVHEAWLRLDGDGKQKWESRAHFFGAAAEAMRRILIENARRKMAQKHGGGQLRVDIDDVQIATREKDEELLAVNEALEKLAAHDPKMAEVVKLRFFVGFTNKETAEALGVSEPTVERWWKFARAWLYTEIRNGI